MSADSGRPGKGRAGGGSADDPVKHKPRVRVDDQRIEKQYDGEHHYNPERPPGCRATTGP